MDPIGVVVVGAVLLIGVVVGLWRRRTEGRFRDVAPAGLRPEVGGRLALAETGGVSGAPERRVVPDAKEPGVIEETSAGPSADGARLDPELLRELGVEAAQATLLQFSSAFCAPCRAVRRVSSEVAAMVPGVRHVEVDAESHLEAVRALGIWRTPTLLVLDAEGRITKRATGVPGKPQLIAALGAVL
ncbi:TlpA family protein disulfide reductase [Actinoplanes sp. CA-131856]